MRKYAALIGAAGAVIAIAGQAAPASALPGAGCTQRGTIGNDNLSVSVTAGQTAVVCLYKGADTLTINSLPQTSRLIITKGPSSSLSIVWNAGASAIGDVVAQAGELTVLRPTSTTVSGSQRSANPNTDAVGATALCATNLQYKDASDFDTLVTATGGANIDWYRSGGVNRVINNCNPT